MPPKPAIALTDFGSTFPSTNHILTQGREWAPHSIITVWAQVLARLNLRLRTGTTKPTLQRTISYPDIPQRLATLRPRRIGCASPLLPNCESRGRRSLTGRYWFGERRLDALHHRNSLGNQHHSTGQNHQNHRLVFRGWTLRPSAI